MRIRIFNNKKQKLTNAEIREAINFFNEVFIKTNLIRRKTIESISVNVVFKPLKTEKAYIEWTDNNIKPRKFRIVVDDKYSKKNILHALAHEMVHLKQYAKGALVDQTVRSNSRWNKKEINENRLDYWDYPWEIEAYGREVGLVIRYLEHKKKTKRLK